MLILFFIEKNAGGETRFNLFERWCFWPYAKSRPTKAHHDAWWVNVPKVVCDPGFPELRFSSPLGWCLLFSGYRTHQFAIEKLANQRVEIHRGQIVNTQPFPQVGMKCHDRTLAPPFRARNTRPAWAPISSFRYRLRGTRPGCFCILAHISSKPWRNARTLFRARDPSRQGHILEPSANWFYFWRLSLQIASPHLNPLWIIEIKEPFPDHDCVFYDEPTP